MSSKLYQLGLHLTTGLGSVLIRQLVAHFGSAEKVYESNLKNLLRVPGVGQNVARQILDKSGLQAAEVELKNVEKHKSEVIFYTDANYPKRLKSLYDAPAMLYSKSNLDFNSGSFVGVVGTRKATDYGRAVTEEIVQGLTNKNIAVMSGLAYGIDIIAHRACLKANVPTVGVMATGLDNIYPSTHLKTSQDIQETGGILTENRFGTKPDAVRFPARNRIIAGMSDVVIIVEAAEKGGALITAEFANNYNREVFAVPGNLHNSYSIGCNKLIQENKAQIFTGVENLLESMRWLPTTPSDQKMVDSAAATLSFTQEESQVIALLKHHGETHIDDLSWHSKIHHSKLATLLLNLEFQGFLRSLPGKRYVLC
jgi:DNA processing protein